VLFVSMGSGLDFSLIFFWSGSMKIICITGATSGVGKTTLAEMLLRNLKNWAACKVTACTGGSAHRCPRGKKDCGVCSSLKKDYEIKKETVYSNNNAEFPFMARSKKDTHRLLKAGAKAVLWVKTKPEFLAKSIKRALARLKGYSGVIFEGNHALQVLNPDLALMVLSPDGRFKRSALEIKNKVDLFIKNVNNVQIKAILEKVRQ